MEALEFGRKRKFVFNNSLFNIGFSWLLIRFQKRKQNKSRESKKYSLVKEEKNENFESEMRYCFDECSNREIERIVKEETVKEFVSFQYSFSLVFLRLKFLLESVEYRFVCDMINSIFMSTFFAVFWQSNKREKMRGNIAAAKCTQSEIDQKK